MEFARQAAPFELLALDDPAQRVPRDTVGEVDGDGGAAAKVSASRRSSSVNRGSAPRLLCAAITPIARSPDDQGHEEARAAFPCRRPASWSTSGSSRGESTRSLRRRSSTRPLFEPPQLEECADASSSARGAGGRLDAQVALGGGQRDQDRFGVDQLA